MTIDEMREWVYESLFGQISDLPEDDGSNIPFSQTMVGINNIYTFSWKGVDIIITEDFVTKKCTISDNRNYFFYFIRDEDCPTNLVIGFGIYGHASPYCEYADNIVFEKYNISQDFDHQMENTYGVPHWLPTKNDVITYFSGKGITYESKYDVV